MKILKIEFSKKILTRFYIYVWAPDEYRWTVKPFAFKYENWRVYFLVGGQDKEKDRRLAGEAHNREEAVERATNYLESWLNDIQAVGRQKILNVEFEEAGGELVFSLWVAHLGLVHLKKGPFKFKIRNGQMYFLSSETGMSEISIERVESRDQAIEKAWF